MSVDGFLNFSTKINTGGFDKGIESIKDKFNAVKSAFSKFGGVIATAFSTSAIMNFADECKNLWNVQLEAETRLGAILKGNLGATDEQIQSLKDYASELQNIGVIGDEVQLSGLQELSTYIENADNLKPMMSVLTDMLAQQYGLNATAESAVTISTMLGKVLSGQTSALSRYGYSFDEAQEQLLKFGTEEERVATLAEVVSASVGGVNEAFAQTNAGKMQQLSNTIGDIKEQFGDAFTQIETIFLPALVKMAEYLAEIATLAQKVAGSLADAFGVQTSNVSAVSAEISANIEGQEALTEAVEETTAAQKKSLAAFDQINTVGETSETTENSQNIAVTPIISDSSIEETVNELSERIQRLFKPVQIAWEDNSPELIANAEYAANAVKSLFSGIGKSFEEVWSNGSGETYIGNIITLFGDVAQALANAWDDGGRGSGVIQSYFDRWNALLELIHAVNSAFREAWNDGTGKKICGNILETVKNINNTVANLRDRFTEAWNENQTGVRIFKAILKIIVNVTKNVEKITKKTAKWAENLDFSPLLESAAEAFESLEPLAENVGEILSDVYENVLLPLGKWTIAEVLPASVDVFSAAVDLLNSVIEVFKPLGKWLYDEFLKPIAEWTGGVIVSVINGIADALRGFSDWISENQTLVQDFMIVVGSLGAAFAISGVIQAAVAAFTAMGGIMGIVSAAATVLSSIIGVLSGVFTFLTNPITLVCIAIGAVIAIGVLLVRHWDEVKTFAADIWSEIEEIMYDFYDSWEAGFKAIADFTGKTLDNIKEKFRMAWNKITEIFKNIGTWFENR